MPQPRSITSTVVLLLALGAALAAGCDGSDDKSDESDGSPAAQGSTGGSDRNGASGEKQGKQNFEPARGRAKGKQKASGLSPDAPKYIGRFTRTVSDREANQIGGRFGSAGRWNLLTGRGSYSISSSRRAFGGRLKVSGSRITFGPPRTTKLPPAPKPQGGLGKNKDNVKRLKQAQVRQQRQRLRRSLRAAREPCGSATGTYRWSLRGGTLTFKRIRDGCSARRVALSKTWSQRE
jgi:hypothetical protein